jgi:hypothetical protein
MIYDFGMALALCLILGVGEYPQYLDLGIEERQRKRITPTLSDVGKAKRNFSLAGELLFLQDFLEAAMSTSSHHLD